MRVETMPRPERELMSLRTGTNGSSPSRKWNETIDVRHNSTLIPVAEALKLHAPLGDRATKLATELNGTVPDSRADQSTSSGKRQVAAALARGVIGMGEKLGSLKPTELFRPSQIADAQRDLASALKLVSFANLPGTNGRALSKPVVTSVPGKVDLLETVNFKFDNLFGTRSTHEVKAKAIESGYSEADADNLIRLRAELGDKIRRSDSTARSTFDKLIKILDSYNEVTEADMEKMLVRNSNKQVEPYRDDVIKAKQEQLDSDKDYGDWVKDLSQEEIRSSAQIEDWKQYLGDKVSIEEPERFEFGGSSGDTTAEESWTELYEDQAQVKPQQT